ncbi:hypothetical protein ACLM5J_13610 [Nocardioides sp. Bht2]|uniref:hypothetical protein n=1 Tax=Nocardioides sp. Bht2 TaxID=3392297 RepID=UPI0039B666F7
MTEHDENRPQGAVPGPAAGTSDGAPGAPGTGPNDPTTVFAQSPSAAAQPSGEPPATGPAKPRFRERVWSWKALTASALAGLIIGGGTGAAIAAVASDDGGHHDRRGQFQPGEGRPGGPGGFGRGGDGQFAPPGGGQMPGQNDGQSDGGSNGGGDQSTPNSDSSTNQS